MSALRPTSRSFADTLIVDQAQQQVQTFFDELKNGTRNYRTISSLSGQIAQEYSGRCILELLQNAHDALANAEPDDPRRISFVLRTSPEPVLLIGNSGCPFRLEDFKGICELGQSPKDPNESVGNKGLGFRSVLEVSSCPEIWSTTPPGSDTSFAFRFDPSVSGQVATAAQEIEEQGLDVRSPFDPERPLVRWSAEQITEYRSRLSAERIDSPREARKFLSPHLLPLPIEGVLPEVEKLLSEGHATIVRLPLDGGRGGACENAVESIKGQLQRLDVKSTIFLPRLKTLLIDIDGEHRILERSVDSAVELSGCRRTRQQRLRVRLSGSNPDNTTRRFHVWSRTFGGNDDPEQTERIRALVEPLPNRWPEVRQVAVSVAVEEAPEAQQGVFVIFLPTAMMTGTGAYINAPFYGSLDRRQINFDNAYNDMLLESVLDLCLDAAIGLVADESRNWQAGALIDLLSSTSPVSGQDWQLMDELHDRALERDSPLENQPLILCDSGWCVPSKARLMPDIPGDDPIGAERWREQAGFAVVSTVLNDRRDAVAALLTKLGGSLKPTHDEWRRTVEHVAISVQARKADVPWDAFFSSLLAVLPEDMRAQPKAGAADPLAAVRFLPTQDRRLLSASDSVKLFFQPVRGADDARDLAGEIPGAVKHFVAFLHQGIRTREEGPQGRSTAVQKFLDGRFARTFRREELLSDVVLAALPPLPVPHGGPEAELCAELFIWTLKLLGNEEHDTLLPVLRRLPTACHGGWLVMGDAIFGPGWPGRLGDLVWSLAGELPQDLGMRLRSTSLLPPEDPRWGTAVEDRSDLFARAGVVDGLRLRNVPEARFYMQRNRYELPATLPDDTPKAQWDGWREAAREEAKPSYGSSFEYAIDGIQLLPEIHYLTTLSQSGRNALSRLVLGSVESWPNDWWSCRIRKLRGESWSRKIRSPLNYWLATLAWLTDGTPSAQPLSSRWLVPASFLRWQRDRYRHLDPLSLYLTRRLEDKPELKAALIRIGLNVYPIEEVRTGPELLEALAVAWAAERIPAGRFDVFLGQIREAWEHLDPAKGLPETLLIRTGQRMFSTCGQDDLADIYLPDSRERTRSLRGHGKHILEMETAAANRMAETLLAATDIKLASSLKEQFLIDGIYWTRMSKEIPGLDETRYGWLPAPLLTIAAHGGAQPSGAATGAWQRAADRLRRARVLECETIEVELADADHVVASSKPPAQWLPGDVLTIRRGTARPYEDLAPAAQAMLDRQDLLKDLRLVLGSLADHEEPTLEQIEAALERAEIDAHAFTDIRHRWAGTISLMVDRIRPVLTLLSISNSGFDSAATDAEHLRKWLSSRIPQWSTQDLLSAARQSRDDHAMGVAAWRALGDIAQLPIWNKALAVLGDRYIAVGNRDADKQTAAHLEEALPLLRGLARYIALKEDNPDLFHDLENAPKTFEARADWSTLWWEVPFGAVINDLRAAYTNIPEAERHSAVLEGARTIDDLRTAFQTSGITIDPNPYDTASLNKRALDEMLCQLRDLHRAWMDSRAAESIAPKPSEASGKLNAAAYLYCWSDAELLEQSLGIIGDAEFVGACNDCASLNEIRERLGLDPKALDARRRERLRGKQEAERQRRTFDVAGTPFEVGTSSYDELFQRLSSLADLVGPRASKDTFTPLAITRPTGDGSGGGRGKSAQTSHLRPSAALRDLVGVVGEIHAYRFLRADFGSDVVTRGAWVSEIRLKVRPLVDGESDTTSDGHGFDFRFRYRGNWYYVEVKATGGDGPSFDLGISEIEAASRFAQARGERWRILRVRNALSDQPEFDWLPNPFEKASGRTSVYIRVV